MRAPSAVSATLRTRPMWPLSQNIAVPVLASHIRAVLSSERVTIRVASGVIATPRTESVWPVTWSNSAPLLASHTRAVLSAEAVTMRVPAGVTATAPPRRVLGGGAGDDAGTVRRDRHRQD